jgi:hypothetical protein
VSAEERRPLDLARLTDDQRADLERFARAQLALLIEIASQIEQSKSIMRALLQRVADRT